MCCVPVTKTGYGAVDRSGVPKSYYLVLICNKTDRNDCKLLTVRVKQQDKVSSNHNHNHNHNSHNHNHNQQAQQQQLFSIQKRTHIKKLQTFEINTGGGADDTEYDFKLHWQNGSKELFLLSPNSLRSREIFAFIIYHCSHYCAQRTPAIIPLELVELEVHGRAWLEGVFGNSSIIRYMNSLQSDLFKPIYQRLCNNNDTNLNNHDHKTHLVNISIFLLFFLILPLFSF
jgi:hypothetical protein